MHTIAVIFLLLGLSASLSGTSVAQATRMDVELGCRESYPANNCEFWVDGVARTKDGYQGWSQVGLHTEIKTRTADSPAELVLGHVLTARNLSKGRENNSTMDLFFPAAYDEDRGLWVIDAVYQQRLAPQGVVLPDLEPEALVYVLKRTKDDVCLWLTDAGEVPFRVAATFTPPVYPRYIGRKQFIWANQRVSVFNQKHACQS